MDHRRQRGPPSGRRTRRVLLRAERFGTIQPRGHCRPERLRAGKIAMPIRIPRSIIVRTTMLFVVSALAVSLAHSQAERKRAVFGGSGPAAGWGSLGLVTRGGIKFY